MVINHFKDVRQVTWHGRGDYFAAVLPEGANRSVIVHQLSRRKSQFPFSKSKGLVQCVMFHPIRPVLFVAVSSTQRSPEQTETLVENLARREASTAIHPTNQRCWSHAFHESEHTAGTSCRLFPFKELYRPSLFSVALLGPSSHRCNKDRRVSAIGAIGMDKSVSTKENIILAHDKDN